MEPKPGKPRVFREGIAGALFRVRICPRELRTGIDRVHNALVYEEVGGGVKSVVIDAAVELADLGDYELECLLEAAE
jgi:hypothetical protein